MDNLSKLYSVQRTDTARIYWLRQLFQNVFCERCVLGHSGHNGNLFTGARSGRDFYRDTVCYANKQTKRNNELLQSCAVFASNYPSCCCVDTVALDVEPQYGFVNPALREWFGVIPPNWLRDPNTALYAIILLSFWQVGHTMMIFLAGLQEIPKELYEAADLDGATFVQKTKYVTFPMLTPTIYFNMIIGVINSFQAFAAIFVLTRGGPSGSTMVYVMYLYQQGIEFLEMGYASALALVLVAIVLVLTIVIMKTSDKWVTYDRV